MKHFWKTRFPAAVLALSVAALSGCGSSAGSSQAPSAASGDAGSTPAAVKEVKIGVIYPLSGNVAKVGQESVEAIKLAVELINESHPELNLPFAADEGLPALGGAKLTLEISDSQGSPEVGLSEAERMITELHVNALFGAYHSSVTKTASNVAEKMEIPFLNPDSTSTALTERGFEWFFRTTPHDGTFVTDTLSFLKGMRDEKGAEIKTVALFHEDTEWGTMLRKQFEEQIPGTGFDIVENIVYSANATNLSSEVMKIKAANPDVLLCGSYTADTILLFRTLKEQNWSPKIMLGQRSGFTAPETVQTIGVKDVEGIISTNLFALDLAKTNPNVEIVNKLFKERTGVDMTDAYARSFTGVYVLAEAINKAGSTDSVAIRDALKSLDVTNDGQYIVPWSGIKFDENGQNIKAGTIITQMFDGTFYTVYPFASAARDAAYPLAPWSQR